MNPLSAPQIAITREMGISHADFFRVFPAVIDHRPFERLPDGIAYADGGRRLAVTLSPESRRRIGMLELPVTSVAFLFDGHTSEQVDAFMARFDRHFHRGGG